MQPHIPPSEVLYGRDVTETHQAVMSDLLLLEQTADPVAAAHGLANLRTVLPGHFAFEEARDGVFDWVVALRPESRETVNALVADHAALLVALKALPALHDGEGQSVPDALAAARAFCHHMREHEQREARMLENLR